MHFTEIRFSYHRTHLALQVHAVVGGTPAYGREFVRGDAPSGPSDFDAWIRRTVLNPQTPLFREARYLLAEETDIREPALYHSVLAAIASGNTTNGGIARYIGRRSDELSHPLTVLEDAALVVREPDLFRGGRATVDGVGLFGELPAEVGHGAINDQANRTQIEVAVAVLAVPTPDKARRILSLGEAKWGEVMGLRHLARLARARDLLAVKKYDTSGTVLACYSAAGFDQDLRDLVAREPGKILLIGPGELYAR